MSQYLLAGLAIAMLAILPAVAASDSPAIRVGIYQNPPKLFINQSGPTGFFPTVLDAIAEAKDWTLSYVPCEWETCLEQVATGELDLMMDVAYSEERAQKFAFNQEPVIASWSVVYSRYDSDIYVLPDLDQRRIAVLANSVQYSLLVEQAKAFDIQPIFIEVDSFEAAFRLLATKAVDAASANHFYWVPPELAANIYKTSIVIAPAKLYFVAPYKNTELLAAIDRQLLAMKPAPDSVYAKAYDYWLEGGLSPAIAASIRRGIVLATSLMLGIFGVILLFWNRTLAKEMRRRQQSEHQLIASEGRYRLLAENTHDLICLHAPTGHYTYVSPSVEIILGYTSEELMGSDPYQLFHPEDRDRLRQQRFPAGLGYQDKDPMTFRMRTKAGGYIWIETLTKAICDAEGNVLQLQTASREITERIHSQEKLRHETLHDPLTGLPNRAYLIEQLRLALDLTQLTGRLNIAVLFLDLDRFQVINKSLGHLVGDQLLIGVAETIKDVLRDEDIAAHLGGDEFIVLVRELPDIRDAVRVAQRLLAALRRSFTIQAHEVFINASIGIVQMSEYHQATTDLLRDADIAMCQAKRQGGDGYEIFDRSMHEEALTRLKLENDLRKACEKQELFLLYQPIVELETGKLFGFESLLRWRHPQQGIISPVEFIPIAEETGLILPIGQWVIEQVSAQLQAWQQITPIAQEISICINCSPKQLQADAFLTWLETHMQTLENYQGQISLEITESLWIKDLATTVAKLNRLKALNIGLSIDDFGTGYSSLSYLSQLPIDMVKIDRAFISHLQERHLNQEIVAAIVALSDPLGVRVVAEGIEAEHQLHRLRQMGCQLGQGYLFARPLPPAEATVWLQANPWTP